MPYGPPITIPAPPPVAPRFTLPQSATIIPEADDRWMTGAALWRYYGCEMPQLFDACDPAREITYANVIASPTFGAFTVVMGIHCSMFGLSRGTDDYLAMARQAFEASEHLAVERELETGEAVVAAANLSLSDAPDTIGGVGPFDTRRAMAELEGYIGEHGQDGVIHASRRVVSDWASDSLVHQEGTGGAARLRTMLGTLVIPGGGYQIGQDDTETAWATGQVEIRRTPTPMVAPEGGAAIQRGTNDAFYMVAREYLVTFDNCIHGDIAIDRAP